MKRAVIRLILALVVVTVFQPTPALDDGGGQPPLCYPKACPAS